MIQLYSEDYGYADIGESDITFSLQNPQQHFFEEPEDFTYSFEVPMTEANLKIFNNHHVSVIVDNYKIFERFETRIISKSLTSMEVSIYKTRILQDPDGAGGTSLSYYEIYDEGKAESQTFSLDFSPLGIGHPYRVKCLLWKWTALRGPVFSGQLHLPADFKDRDWTKAFHQVKDVAFKNRFMSLEVPMKAFLTYILGYIPDESLYDDNHYISFPIDCENFRVYGELEVHFTSPGGSFIRPDSIYFKPKYGRGLCYWSPKEKVDPWGSIVDPYWNKRVFKHFPVAITRDMIYLRRDKNANVSSIKVDKSNDFVNHIEDLAQYARMEGIKGASQYESIKVNIDERVSLKNKIKTPGGDTIDNPWYYFQFDVPTIINQYYEDIARELPIFCEKDKIPDNLFVSESFQTILPENILSFTEKEILREDYTVKRFKYADFWAPYQLDRNLGDEVEMVCTDIGLNFEKHYTLYDEDVTPEHRDEYWGPIPYEFGLTGWTDARESKYIWEDQITLHPIKKQNWSGIAVSEMTMWYWKNYVQGTTNEVEIELLNYNFSGDIIIGDPFGNKRRFRVDNVETSDFKRFKLTMIEIYV